MQLEPKLRGINIRMVMNVCVERVAVAREEIQYPMRDSKFEHSSELSDCPKHVEFCILQSPSRLLRC